MSMYTQKNQYIINTGWFKYVHIQIIGDNRLKKNKVKNY
jgi:hypothetical protein